MSRRAPALVAAATAALLALAGCTAEAEPAPTVTPSAVALPDDQVTDVERNGVEYLSGDAAVDGILAAMDDAGPATVEGVFQERADEEAGGPTRRLQFTFEGTDTRFRADVTAADVSARIVVVDGRAYVTGDARLAALIGVPEADGGIVCLASDDRRISAWAPVLSPAAFVESIVASTDGVTLDAAGTTAADAASAEFVLGAGGSPIGTLTVATTGPAVPLRLVAADPRGDVDATFAWDADPQIAAPADVAVPCP